MLGGRFIFLVALLSALVLSLFLYTISAGSAYPPSANVLSSPNLTGSQPIIATQVQAVALSLPTQENSPVQSQADCLISSEFPEKILQWCSLITHYAVKRGLEPDLIAALIWQESGGNPSAFSASGAVGLMQIMPRDGLSASFMCVNGPCFTNRPSISELEDPEFNISYGTKMLAGLHTRSGDLREALKSYGPMNVGYSYADKVLGIWKRYGAREQ